MLGTTAVNTEVLHTGDFTDEEVISIRYVDSAGVLFTLFPPPYLGT